MRIVPALVLVAFAASLAACAGDTTYDVKAPPGPTRTPRTDATPASGGFATAVDASPAPSASPIAAVTLAPAATPGAPTLTLIEFKIEPFLLEMGRGALVVRNIGGLPHRIAIYGDTAFTQRVVDTGEMAPGTSKDLRLDAVAGTYYARCEIHPLQMRAAITLH